jgi:DNA-binding CsgD family transcriptional regulator/tetratricopeptide (TPR) repeat protein
LNRRVRTRQVIEAAAVLGTTFEWRLLAETIDVAEIDVLNALHMAIGLQLLGPDDGPDSERFSFRSEATRTTVLAHIADSRRREIASSALAVLERLHPELSGTRLTQAAHLAILADQPERAAELWRHAGQRFAQLGAPAEALGCFDAASRASKAQAEEPLDAVLARAHAGEPDVARLAARIAAAEGRWDDARSLAMQSETAAVDATSVAAVELRARVEAVSDPREAQRLLDRAKTAARREEMGQFEVVVQWQSARADAGMMLDVGPLEAVRTVAVEAGLARLVAAVDGDLAAVHAARWDAERAAAAARRQRELVRRLGLLTDPAQHAEVLASQCSVLALNGDGDGVAAIERQLEQLDADCRLRVRCAESQATLALVGADVAAALAAFDRAVELARSCPTATPRPFAWQALLRAVYSEDGMPDDRSRRRASDAVPVGPWEQALLDCAAAIEAGLAGDAEGAVRSFARSLAGFDSLGEVGPRYVALWLASERAAATGWGEPELWSREAARWFEARGHHRLAAACRSVLRSIGAKVPRRGRGESRVPSALAGMGLTSREVDVLALVAEGLTNKEVARRLFISSRTVGNHVAKLLAKTGTRRRSELVELAARYGLLER